MITAQQRNCGRSCAVDANPAGGSVWYASEMLARLLSYEPERVRNKRVLDLGAGCGLLGMGAAGLTVVITQYYTDYIYYPVITIAEASVSGP